MKSHKHLTEEQKQFIVDNYKKMSDKHISQELDIPRKAVQKYHKQIIEEGLSPGENIKEELSLGPFKGSTARKISIVLFVIIIFFAITLRKHTFNLPHFRGDQHHYAGLAFKLNTQGMSGYNLSGINMYGIKNFPNVVQFAPAEDKGQILKDLERGNITYYDQPLHHIPFGFPAAIMISHKIFAPGLPYFMLAIPNDMEIIRNAGPGVGLRNFRFPANVQGKQFYLVIIPLFFSLLLITFVYYTAKELYDNEWVAFIAMFLMAICPIDILTSQKVWADDMTAGLSILAVFFYVLSVKKEKPLFALAAGICCGLSAITKQSGAFIVFVIVIWHFINNSDRLFRKKTFLKVIFDKNLIFFGLGALASAAYWFLKVYSVYGDPVYRPHQAGIGEAAKTDWFKTVGGRPRYLYLVGIPFQNPLFGLAYLSPIFLWLDKKNAKKTLLSIIWIAVFLYIFQGYLGGGGKEHRYMLPAYPAFAILGAYVANKLRVSIDKSMGFSSGTILLVIALAASAYWSIPMAMEVLFYNGALIMKPF